jgi:hypothetical protein
LFPERAEPDDIKAEHALKNDEFIRNNGKEEAAERILDMINPSNSHPDHLSAEDFFG